MPRTDPDNSQLILPESSTPGLPPGVPTLADVDEGKVQERLDSHFRVALDKAATSEEVVLTFKATIQSTRGEGRRTVTITPEFSVAPKTEPTKDKMRESQLILINGRLVGAQQPSLFAVPPRPEPAPMPIMGDPLDPPSWYPVQNTGAGR